MAKAYSYLRFSTPEQAQGDSKRRQSEAARTYAAKHGLELDGATYHDLGVSAHYGKNAEAGGALAAFLEAVDAGLIERGAVLLVESLDRISRQTVRKAVRTMEDIVDRGIELVDLSDGERVYSAETLDKDPTAFLMMALRFMRGNEESAMKARRLKAVWANKRANAGSKPLTARAPAWLRLVHGEGWQVIEDRADIVRRVFRMAADGTGEHTIAATLNSEDVQPFGDGERRGRHWHRSYVTKLTRNPAVIGTLVPHTTERDGNGRKQRKQQAAVEGYFPLVVDRDTYERVQALRMDARAPQRGRHAAGPIQNVLGGLARCPLCQGSMTRVTKGSSAKAGRPYLVCTAAKVGAKCRYHAVPLDRVEAALRERAAQIVHEAPAVAEAGVDLQEEAAALRANIEAMEDALGNLVTAVEQGGPSVTLRGRIRESETAIEDAKAREAALWRRMSAAQGPLVERRLADLEAALTAEPFDIGRANVALRQTLSGVTVDYLSGDLGFDWLHGGSSWISGWWPEVEGSGPKGRTAARRRTPSLVSV